MVCSFVSVSAQLLLGSFEVFLMASVFKPSRKRKCALKEQTALMRRMKTANPDDSEDSDDSLKLPRPSESSDEGSFI